MTATSPAGADVRIVIKWVVVRIGFQRNAPHPTLPSDAIEIVPSGDADTNDGTASPRFMIHPCSGRWDQGLGGSGVSGTSRSHDGNSGQIGSSGSPTGIEQPRTVSGPIGYNIVTVTILPEIDRCGWCRRPMAHQAGPGRPRRFCSPSHRQRAYEARRRADALHVPAGQVVVAEQELDRLHDRLYRLESAIEDVDADLAGSRGPKAYQQAFEHVYEAARELTGFVVEPVRQ